MTWRAIVLTSMLPALCQAHSIGVSKGAWRILPAEGLIEVTFGIHDNDVDQAVDLYESPLPDDLEARGQELRRRVLAGFVAGVTVTNARAPCAAEPIEARHDQGIEVRLRWRCSGPLTRIDVALEWLRRMAPGHRNLSRIRTEGVVGEEVKIFTRSQVHYVREYAVTPAAATVASGREAAAPPALAPGGWETFRATFLWGFEHILDPSEPFKAWDHLLFLLALLALGGGLRDLLKIVTSFTVAHSLTAGLVYARLLAPPSNVVEACVAGTIVFVAAENFWVRDARWRWLVAFVFGLVHGFAFAGAFDDPAFPRGGLVVTMLTFNLGVEAGQLAVVGACWPLIRLAARRSWYRRWLLYPASAVAVVGGVVALIDRTVGLR